MKNIEELIQRVIDFEPSSRNGFVCIGYGVDEHLTSLFDIPSRELYSYNRNQKEYSNGLWGNMTSYLYFITESYAKSHDLILSEEQQIIKEIGRLQDRLADLKISVGQKYKHHTGAIYIVAHFEISGMGKVHYALIDTDTGGAYGSTQSDIKDIFYGMKNMFTLAK